MQVLQGHHGLWASLTLPPHLRALPAEGWASAPSSCWESNIKEDVRETGLRGMKEGGEERGEMGRESGPVYSCLAQCLYIVELT